MIKVLFFGKLSDASQPISCELPEDVTTAGDFAFWLASNNSLLAHGLAADGVRIAVNQKMTNKKAPLKDGDEIAFMSPLSGG